MKTKNPAAVALGKLGAKKGGQARAAQLSDAERSAIASKGGKARMIKMTQRQRSESARHAAQARWSKKGERGSK